MSSVQDVRIKDGAGKVLAERIYLGSCLAIFQHGSNVFEKTLWDTAETLEVTFEDVIKWGDKKHPLIQGLVPGIYWEGHKVTVPLAGIPVDQIICALRLIRSFRDVNHFVTHTENYGVFNSDGQPSWKAPTFAQILREYPLQANGKPPTRISNGDLASSMYETPFNKWLSTRPAGLTGALTPEEVKEKLDAGIFNPGWMPPLREGNGYLKGYYCIPVGKMYPNQSLGGEYTRFHEKAVKWIGNYLDKHGVYPFTSVDHCLALCHHPLTKEEFSFD